MKKYLIISICICLLLCGCGKKKTKENVSSTVKESDIGSSDVIYKLALTCGDKAKDSYVTLNSDKIAFNEKKTATKTENNQSLSVTVYEGKISIKDLIDDQIIEEKDYINPGNKNATCEKTTKIVKVYRDSDYVYCYKVNKNALNCLTAEYKNSLDSDYAIDTCIWK